MRTTQRRTPAANAPTPRDGDMLAALDLGSNSFHMVVAQRVLGQLRVVDRLRETVRMAEGLDGFGGMSAEAQERALACLSRFGQRIADIPPQHVRAVATNSVRQLRDPEAFLRPAEAALGHPIEVISGREEARLVYLGVAHEQPPEPEQKRLVIDIGGGSTEFIIGRGAKTADLPIKDGNISRRHAAIIFQNGAFYMKDLGSTNGVEYQGRRVDGRHIQEGDVYQLCDYELRFTYR